jgi:hypothetical protein
MTQDLFEGDAWNFADDMLMGDHVAEGSVGPGRGDIAPLPTFSDYRQEEGQISQLQTETDVYVPMQGKRRIFRSPGGPFRCENESMRLLVTGVNLCRIDSKLYHVMNNVLMPHVLFLVALVSDLSKPHRVMRIGREPAWEKKA